MKALKDKLLHNMIMEPRKFWKKTIIYSFSLILITSLLSFTVSYNLYNDEDVQIIKAASLYEKLESETMLSTYVNKDSVSTKLKISKLESLSGITFPKNINVDHLDLMVVTAAYYDIPLRIFLRQAYKESVFNPIAISHKNAKGYFQIRDITYKTYYKKIYVTDTSPESNIRLAGYIMKDLKSRYKSWDLTLAAYNAGPSIVDQYKGIPDYTETKDYIKFILL